MALFNFSLDYSKVILIESYSCGTACGGVSFKTL